MKTALFTLAALFGLGLGLAVVGVEFGRRLLGGLLAMLGLGVLTWVFADRLPSRAAIAAGSRAVMAHSAAQILGLRLFRANIGLANRLVTLSRMTSGHMTLVRTVVAKAPRLPLSPLLSVLMGLSLGAALARDHADLPAALLCGGLAGTLHLLATAPAPRRRDTTPTLPRIGDDTQTHLARLIAAIAPCRDPHLHVAARALRRTATALAAEVDSNSFALPEARHALTLWLPALADAAEALRQHHITQATLITPDAANPKIDQTAALTSTFLRVTNQLTQLTQQPETGTAQPAFAQAAT